MGPYKPPNPHENVGYGGVDHRVEMHSILAQTNSGDPILEWLKDDLTHVEGYEPHAHFHSCPSLIFKR
jgi:hypothetical protein